MRTSIAPLRSPGQMYYTDVVQKGANAMPMSVRLDAKTTDLVDRLARRSGRTKSEVVRAALVEFARRETSGEQAASAYDALADLVGRFDSGGKQLSVRTGEQFAAHLRERKRARRLD